MIYAQINAGQKLHLACEPGEELRGEVIRSGFISAPICGSRNFKGRYRMTINVSLGELCRNCNRVWRADRWRS